MPGSPIIDDFDSAAGDIVGCSELSRYMQQVVFLVIIPHDLIGDVVVIWCGRMSNAFINAIHTCVGTGMNEEKVGILEESRTELFHSLTVISTCKFNNN